MAQTPKSIPANYPQPLGTQILKADGHLQASILRQEIVTDLLGILNETREPAVRSRLVRLVEGYLKAGVAAAHKAEELWPSLEEAKETFAALPDLKPSLAKKHLKQFEQFDGVQHRSLDLLEASFGNIRVILERLRGPVSPAPAPAAASAPPPGRVTTRRLT